MDRRRPVSPVYSRQWSGSSTGSSSPAMSPAHPQSRLAAGATGFSSVKRTQNAAAKVAAQRLAKVMASQTSAADEEDDDDDENGFKFAVPAPPAPSPFSSLGNNNYSSGISVSRPNRSPSPALGRNFVEHASSVRSTSAGRPSMSVRSAAVVPPSRSSLRSPVAIPPIEPPSSRNNKFIPNISPLNSKGKEDQREASALRDELDMLEEENEIIIDKLRHAEIRREAAEARARELEKQVATLGEGVSLEVKLLSKKEELLRQKELALKAAVAQNRDGKNEEVAALRTEVENLKDEAASALEQLREAESEAKALRTMTQRMILTQEEMEEVVLKRCWLARYWGLAVQHGICADIAVSKHEHWSSLAPLPFEVVISAGQKAKEESWDRGGDDPDRSKLVRDISDLTGEGNIETMLSVEMGLRELASLKVEDAVVLALALHRRPNLVRQSSLDSKSAVDPKFMEAFELSEDETVDVQFKEAWLTYFWRRAKVHGVEEDIAEERLQFWINRSGQQPTSHDAVDVERGLVELRKLGIEQQLWEASRKEIDQPLSSAVANHKSNADSETSP
ncbi:hypothetical protein ACB092_04G211900 [Castanea dentata]